MADKIYSKCWYNKVCTNECSNSCIRFNEMKFLMDFSGIPEKQQYPKSLQAGSDYDAFCQLNDIKNNVNTFVDNGNSLYLYSKNIGNGKTSWAIKIMLKYFDLVWAGNGFKPRGVFIHVPTFLNKLKDFNNSDEHFEDVKRLLTSIDLVIWDDIASTDMSSYDHSQLLTYIDQRVLSCKSNIYTGNRDNSDIEKALGIRLASRVWNNSIRINLVGGDRRGNGNFTDNF